MSNEEMKSMLQAILEAQQLTHAKVVSLETRMDVTCEKVDAMQGTITTMQGTIETMQGDIKTIKETMATKDDLKIYDAKINHWAKRTQKNELDIALLKEKIGMEF